MVTQCTMCRTWFQVSHEQLHAAHGLVRCSSCGTVFNALATLRDRVPEDESAPEDDDTLSSDEPFDSDAGFAAGDAATVPPLLAEAVRVGRGRRWPWILALTAAALLLAGQLINAGRRTLAAAPVLGPGVVAAYRLFGQRISPVIALARYRILGASLDAVSGAGGALALHGVLHNGASYPQPLPMIAVTLTDRYGDTVAARVLAPHEYGAAGVSALGADLNLPFHVKLADPGARAVGFSLTLCKRRAGIILCQMS